MVVRDEAPDPGRRERAGAAGEDRPEAAGAWRGTLHIFIARDIGFSIDLEDAQRRIRSRRGTLRRRRRPPVPFDYTPPPLVVEQSAAPIIFGEFETVSRVDAVLYDFGAVSVRYRIDFDHPPQRLVLLAEAVSDDERLVDDSRRRAEELLAALGPAVRRPEISDLVEQYMVVHVRDGASLTPGALLASPPLRALAAQILRVDRQPLSEMEMEEALARRLSYSPHDACVVDWEGALVVGEDPGDVRAVLEFANVELLELRYLDRQLDDALDEAYERARTRRRFSLPGTVRADLRRIAELQVDAALLFEGVNNALKLVGDQYLARVYRLASERFHLSEWDASILRKIQTLESIYQKTSDAAASRRMELLEWIIIILIALSIAMPFVPGLGGGY